MIKLECNNYLVMQTMKNYLEKKFLLADDDKKYFCIIKIEETEKHLLFKVNDFKKEISLPVDLNFLSSEILKLIIDINLPIRDFKYFPYQRLVENDKKKSLLSDIQNIILNNLLLFSEGVDKDILYKSIWKRDQDIHINKLDTHLTNLKKKLKDDLNISINFQSHKKKLRLLID